MLFVGVGGVGGFQSPTQMRDGVDAGLTVSSYNYFLLNGHK